MVEIARQTSLDRIKGLLTDFVRRIEVDNAAGHYDINVHAEIILIPLLAAVYGYRELKTLNVRSGTFPGIDLGDEEARVAIQVTSTSSREKLVHTLQQFVKHKHYEDYDRLVLYIITKKHRNGYAVKSVEQAIAAAKEEIASTSSDHPFDFDIERDILDYKDLMRDINNLDLASLQEVEGILAANVQSSSPAPRFAGGSFHRGDAPLDLNSPELPYVIPYPNPEVFEGRDVTALHALLQSERRVRVIPGFEDLSAGQKVGVTGRGGIGKTLTAARYSWQYLDAYTNGIYWVSLPESEAEDPTTLEHDSIAAIKSELVRLFDRIFTASDHAERTTSQKLNYILDFFDATPDRLLVVDNLVVPEAANCQLDGSRALTDLKCSLLVTSRSRSGSGLADFPIQILEPEDALQVLLLEANRDNLLDRPDDLELHAASELCSLAGYLPHLIAIAGRLLLGEPEVSIEQLTGWVRDEGANAIDQSALPGDLRDLATKYEKAHQAIFGIPWRFISDNELAQRLLFLMTAFPRNTQVPVARLELMLGAEALPGDDGRPSDLERRALRDLHRYSFVERWQDNRAIRLHPDLYDYVSDRLTETDNASEIRKGARRLVEALQQPEIMVAHLVARGVFAVEEDLRAIEDWLNPESELSPRYHLIRRALRLEQRHLLQNEEGANQRAFLAQQLLGRFLTLERDKDTPRPGYLAEYQQFLDMLAAPYIERHSHFTGESRLLEMVLEHEDSVKDILVLPEDQLASASLDHTVRIWNLDSGEHRVLKGHSGGINALALLPDGRLASASFDCTVRIWNLINGESHVLEGHGDGINALALLPDGSLASASLDHTVRIWNLKSSECRVLEGHDNAVRALTVLPDGSLASASLDHTLRIWDLTSGKCRVLIGHSDRVNALAVLPDDRLASASGDHTVRIWDINSDECRVLEGHGSWVAALALLPNGRLATASGDHTVRIWDINSDECRVLIGHSDRVNALAVLPDGTLASASLDATVRTWDINSGKSRVLKGHGNGVSTLAVLPNSRLASACGDHTVGIWNLANVESRMLEGHGSWVTALAMLPDGRLASASHDATMRIWNLKSNECRVLEGHDNAVRALTVLPDGSLASASLDHTLRIWDLTSGKSGVLEGHSGPVYALTLLSNGKLASASHDATVRIWDIKSGECRVLEGHGHWVTGLALLPNGRLASASYDATIRIWDLEGGKCQVLEGHSDWIGALAVLPDDRLASASGDHTVRIWDINSGECRVLEGHGSWVAALALLPNGRLATASGDHTVRIWDINSDECRVLIGHSDRVNALAVLPDGTLASASDDRTVRIWNLKSGESTAHTYLEANPTILSFSSQRQVLLAGDAAGSIYALKFHEGKINE